MHTTADTFADGIYHLDAAARILGDRTATMLRLVTFAQRDPATLSAALEEWRRLDTAAAPTPPPAPRPERHPAPADFAEERQIGTIGGEPVTGCAAWCDIDAQERRFQVRVSLAGLTLWCDGAYLEIGSYNTDEGLALRDVAALAELWQAGAIQQLAELGRAWCNVR